MKKKGRYFHARQSNKENERLNEGNSRTEGEVNIGQENENMSDIKETANFLIIIPVSVKLHYIGSRTMLRLMVFCLLAALFGSTGKS